LSIRFMICCKTNKNYLIIRQICYSNLANLLKYIKFANLCRANLQLFYVCLHKYELNLHSYIHELRRFAETCQKYSVINQNLPFKKILKTKCMETFIRKDLVLKNKFVSNLFVHVSSVWITALYTWKCVWFDFVYTWKGLNQFIKPNVYYFILLIFFWLIYHFAE
jgi:hypothetical protein